MDAVRNPYAPGAGTPPPELAGRADILEAGVTALRRAAQGRPSRSLILVGLRGVGKTVLLNRLKDTAENEGFRAGLVEASEGRSLPDIIVPELRSILLSLSTVETAREAASRGLRALKGLMRGLRLRVGDFDLGVDVEAGLADSGRIETDLPDLAQAVAEAARAAHRPVALFVDELQYVSEAEFGALIMAVHRVAQRNLPLVVVGAGLPQIVGLAGASKSYAERLFRYPQVGALKPEDAENAVVKPAAAEGVHIEPEAVAAILRETERYPYFLQQWSYEAWNVASNDRITVADVARAGRLAIEELDESFFRVRFERCTPAERTYMRALAELGPGTHRSGDIAEQLGVKVTSAAPTRNALIKKGMIYSPSHGDTAFTVPLFDQYMRRVMPTAGK